MTWVLLKLVKLVQHEMHHATLLYRILLQCSTAFNQIEHTFYAFFILGIATQFCPVSRFCYVGIPSLAQQ